jgi:dienelactone hydrolase
LDNKIKIDSAKHGWVLQDTPVYDAGASEHHWLRLAALFKEMLNR